MAIGLRRGCVLALAVLVARASPARASGHELEGFGRVVEALAVLMGIIATDVSLTVVDSEDHRPSRGYGAAETTIAGVELAGLGVLARDQPAAAAFAVWPATLATHGVWAAISPSSGVPTAVRLAPIAGCVATFGIALVLSALPSRGLAPPVVVGPCETCDRGGLVIAGRF